MNVVITSESRFYQNSAGQWLCPDGTYGQAFWQRYLDVFDRVTVVARGSTRIIREGVPVEGSGVSLLPLVDGHGALGAISRWSTWQRQLGPVVTPDAAYILRMPGQIGIALGQILKRSNRPFGVEVVGDPAAVFVRGSYRHMLRPAVRFFFQRAMSQLCRRSVATAYVTERHLQRRYPPNARAFTTHYSSAELPSSAYAAGPRNYLQRPFPMHLIHIGTMSQPYKGQHDLLDAVAICARSGRSVQLALVGDGRFRPALEHRARQDHLSESVRFLGQIPAGIAIQQALDQADVFVMPSITEGLPRALLEAQARGLPCLATRVGGVPELLADSELVLPQRPAQLAVALMQLLDDPNRLSRLSEENLARARRFASPILRQRRTLFYQQVQDRAMRSGRARISEAA